MKLRNVSMKSISLAVRILVIVLVVFLIVNGASYAYRFGYSIFMDEAAASASESRDVEVTLLEGSGARDIAKQLSHLVLLRTRIFFTFRHCSPATVRICRAVHIR